jgi:hypothetical protein
MAVTKGCFLRAALWGSFFLYNVEAFYLPGVNPQSFEEGDE